VAEIVNPEAKRVGLVWDERYLWHDTRGSAGPLDGSERWIEPGDYGEGPDARRRLKSLLEVSGLAAHLVALPARPASLEQLAAIHDRGYLERVRRASEHGGGRVGPNARVGAGGFEIAALAAGGVTAAVEAVLAGRVERAYALVRPPGHHALPASGMGNCVFANVAVAVRAAQAAAGIRRVAIVDWDVHHGNGTEQIFASDDDVLTVSLHQSDWYPYRSGRAIGLHERPRGIVNVPLPAGSGTGAYLTAVEQIVLPALEQHEPELVVVACGYDAAALDPYGRMLLHSESFREMARLVCDAAGVLCADRIVFAHEGGYAPLYVPFCGLAVLEELVGLRTEVRDPFLERYQRPEFDELRPHEQLLISSLISH
jgi:acetoin utilization deacetylase AcuC-like enzyme